MRLLFAFVLTSVAASAADPKSACAACHPKIFKDHAATGMARALDTAADGAVLRSHAKLTFEQSPYRYEIVREGSRSLYRVTDGKTTLEAPISWAFGQGFAGQTYVFERNGVWHESRVSYYRDIDSLDLTVGARPQVPRNVDEAMGRELSERGASECFNCHSTGAIYEGAVHPERLTPGVQCQRCHLKADEHAASMQKGDASPVIPARLGKLSTEDLLNNCGQCHRTWALIATDGPHNITNVRFQPYRLANAKCYDTSDARIRCTTCHDPHNEPDRPAAFYDARCQACHSSKEGVGKAGAKICKIGNEKCYTCHMPKIELKEAHNKFTDHWIRIVRPGEPYPN